jgi:Glycerol-3-phosphate responsive antiterminator (mRNA-binding)
MQEFASILHENPVIAALHQPTALERAVQSKCKMAFLLAGNIGTLENTISILHAHDKRAYVHMDLMDGFGRDRHAIRFICGRAGADGVITTHSQMVRAAKEEGVFVIQRLFLIDTLSLRSGLQSAKQNMPNAVEIMPGIISNISRGICEELPMPVIAGGFICTKDDIIQSLSAGVVGISTSIPELWDME